MKTKYIFRLFATQFLASSVVAVAATYPELAERTVPRAHAGSGYGNTMGMIPGYPVVPRPAYGGGPAGNSAMYLPPSGGNGMPDPRQMRWTYGQTNAASDPYWIWGLRTQGMYVPWSTPMSSWTNAQNWDWWRTRAGDSGPPPPLW